MTSTTTTIVVAGAVSTSEPLTRMLQALTSTGGGCQVLHVEDAAADRLRAKPVDGVTVEGIVDRTARLAPERVWAPLADEAIVAAVYRRPAAVVIYPHREYDPAGLFPRLRTSCESAGVPLVNGCTGKLIRRSPTDNTRAAVASFSDTPLANAIAASLAKATS